MTYNTAILNNSLHNKVNDLYNKVLERDIRIMELEEKLASIKKVAECQELGNSFKIDLIKREV